MKATARKTYPKTADLSRFHGKDILQFYPRRLKDTAVIMVNCTEYHLHPAHAGQQTYVVLDRGAVCNVVNAEGQDIFFAPTAQDVIHHFNSNS